MKVWIETKKIPRRWWFARTVYCVCTEFMSWPHYSLAEAEESAATMRMYLSR